MGKKRALNGTLVFLVGLVALAVPRTSPAQSSDTPTYTNVQVVSVDAAARTLVVRNASGAQETVSLDDVGNGVGNLKKGDEVFLAVHYGPGRTRGRLVTKSEASLSGPSTGPRVPVSAELDVPPYEPLLATFTGQVASLAAEADRVDRSWLELRRACDVVVSGRYDGAREWLSLWDAQARVDLSSGFCRDLYGQIIANGQSVNTAMASAEEAARRSLLPSDIRDVQRRYTLDWSGWGRTPPAPEER
jgi:hypothetical protein